MVNISYTGLDGKTTSFGANSPKEAMTRLRGIKGYNGGIVDSAAAGLAKGFAARHKNATRMVNMRGVSTANLTGANGNNVIASPFGVAARVQNVTGVRMDDDGNLVATTQERYVSQGGNVAAVAPSKTRNLGKVGSSSDASVSESDVANIVNSDGVTESIVNNITNNETHINAFVTKIVENNKFITQIANLVASSLVQNLHFSSESDSNVTFDVSNSGKDIYVKIGVYYT